MNAQPTVFVDVREPYEYAAGHVEDAVNVPLSELMKDTSGLAGIPKDAHVVVYCNSGNRSGAVLPLFKKLGYTDVENGINRQQVQETLEL